MSAKKLYVRLVGKLLAHWTTLYPMVEWIGPEEAAERMARELAELRRTVREVVEEMESANLADVSRITG